jgi:hypothetical protein
MNSIRWFILAFVAALATPGLARAQYATGQGQVKAFIVQGDVRLKDGTGNETALTRYETFGEGNTIVTGANGSTLLIFSNGAALQVEANTTLTLVRFDQEPFDPAQGAFLSLERDPSLSNTTLKLQQGAIKLEVKQLDVEAGSKFTVNTIVGSTRIQSAPSISTFVVSPNSNNEQVITIQVADGTMSIRVTFRDPRIAFADVGLVQISSGGRVVFTVTTNASGEIPSLQALGQNYPKADAQKSIAVLYNDINTARVREGLPAVTPPEAVAN